MQPIKNNLGVILIALVGLMLLTLGIYELATATSNIHTFRIIGLAPAIFGVALLIVTPIAKA